MPPKYNDIINSVTRKPWKPGDTDKPIYISSCDLKIDRTLINSVTGEPWKPGDMDKPKKLTYDNKVTQLVNSATGEPWKPGDTHKPVLKGTYASAQCSTRLVNSVTGKLWQPGDTDQPIRLATYQLRQKQIGNYQEREKVISEEKNTVEHTLPIRPITKQISPISLAIPAIPVTPFIPAMPAITNPSMFLTEAQETGFAKPREFPSFTARFSEEKPRSGEGFRPVGSYAEQQDQNVFGKRPRSGEGFRPVGSYAEQQDQNALAKRGRAQE